MTCKSAPVCSASPAAHRKAFLDELDPSTPTTIRPMDLASHSDRRGDRVQGPGFDRIEAPTQVPGPECLHGPVTFDPAVVSCSGVASDKRNPMMEVTVAAVGDILRRFRFHGVPGAPAPAGVPVDRTAEIEAELAPVFALLEAAQVGATTLVEEATADTARRHAAAAEQARALLVEARSQADAARAQSAAVRLAQAQGQSRALAEGARREVERIALVCAERTPHLVEELVRRVLSLGELTDWTAPGPTRNPTP